METAQMLEGLNLIVIALYLLTTLSHVIKYFRLKTKYGKTNAKGMFWVNFKIPFLVPDRKSKRYKDWSSTLLSAAVDLSVERFYTLKYTLAAVAMVAMLAVHLTNEDVKVSLILQNMNMSRNIYEHIDFDGVFISKESELVREVNKYLKNANIEFSDNKQAILNALEYRIEQAGLAQTAESARETAERVLNKAIMIKDLRQDMTPYLYILLAAALVFKTPDILVIIKLTLVEKKKDWEILNCMLVYSAMSALPVCRTEMLISCMQDVSRIYKIALGKFKNALESNKKEEIEEILNTVKEDDFQEILETLIIASEIGVSETSENINDMLDNKIKWLEVYAIRNRKAKFAIAIIPVSIVLLLLFSYMMEGINIMNYALKIEL